MLCLRNVVPASLLKDRWLACHSATLFSATLSPARYLQDMLGLPDSSAWVDVPSAFDAQQLKVHVSCHISTRYRDRAVAGQPGDGDGGPIWSNAWQLPRVFQQF